MDDYAFDQKAIMHSQRLHWLRGFHCLPFQAEYSLIEVICYIGILTVKAVAVTWHTQLINFAVLPTTINNSSSMYGCMSHVVISCH